MSGLYIVATPIGNLGDISERARQVLAEVDVIAAEDTRHTGRLLKQLGIETRLITLHAHNEETSTAGVLKLLEAGQSVALVSDAGTPLISDPGYRLVQQCHQKGLAVMPVPGASAVAAALSVSGLPVNRFTFEGFLPSKALARLAMLKGLAAEPRTIVVFEAPHRIGASVSDIQTAMGADRQMTICRELTKTFEQIVTGTAAEIAQKLAVQEIPAKGEFVIVICGSDQQTALDADMLLAVLLEELSPSKAAALAARLTSSTRDVLYRRALALKGKS